MLSASIALSLWLAASPSVSPSSPFTDNTSRALVLIFTRTDCPISNRYAPEIKRIYDAYSTRGVKFYLVYPDREETAASIAKHREDYGYPMPAIEDPSHQLVARASATITPEAAVFVPIRTAAKSDWRLMYHGRIDDRYIDFGKSRQQASVHDLQNAIDAVLAGRAPSPAVTKSIGCYIADLR
ncbi:MAG TPA: redoxin domain-containing protein, partial [Bryobacteraceae bacterium]